MGAAPLRAQGLEDDLRAVRLRLEDARAEGLLLISPRRFAEAEEKLAEAAERYEEGASVGSVRSRLEEARAALDEAERLLEAGRRLFGDVLAARSDALEVDAPARAPDRWEQAEALALEAGRRLERGEEEAAAARIGRAANLFREAELEAVRSDVLARALEARVEAMKVNARELAPDRFAAAEEQLREADRILGTDRTRRREAAELGDAAAAAFDRAAELASLADSVARRQVRLEEVIGRHEREVARLARQLDFEPDFTAGIPPVVDKAVATIASLQEDRRNLDAQLARSEEEGRGLAATLDSLEAQLSGLEQREAEIAARLRERERREARLREVGAIFNDDEGRVVISGDQLILRLYGLSFESGSDEIRPEHYPLLTKVQRVLREFPDAPVTIEGHTDSEGNDEFNRALSRRRAFAVREYLLASMPISADRLAAVGFGEDQPIASNDTAEGRERNRRIDVVLDLAEG